MIEYKVINYKNESDFEQAISDYLNNGWILVGGATTYVTEQAQTHFIQAITRII